MNFTEHSDAGKPCLGLLDFPLAGVVFKVRGFGFHPHTYGSSVPSFATERLLA
jgi:hypothetical protein